MPFVRGRIVIDFHWRAKARAAIRAASKHYVCTVAVAWRPNTAQHVNVVIRWSTRTVHCQEYLRCQSSRIYIPADPHATQVDLSNLFEDWRLIPNLRVAGAKTPKATAHSTDEQIAVRIHVRCSVNDTLWNIDRALPGHAAICGTAESAGRAREAGVPKLVLKPMTWSGGLINRKPLLVASARPRKACP
jgi:hypothetical protein